MVNNFFHPFFIIHEHTMDNRGRISVISALGAVFIFIFSLLTATRSGYITVDTYVNSTSAAFVGLLSAISVLQIFLVSRKRLISFYFALLLTFTFAMTSVVSYGGPVFVFLLIATVLEGSATYFASSGVSLRGVRASVAVIALIIMIYLGNLFQFVLNRPDTGIIVESTGSVFVSLGQNIPLLENGGFFILTRHFDLILSFQQYVIFFALSILIAENYYQIIKVVTSRGSGRGRLSTVVSGMTGALSCQCESYIAFLPAFSILLINYVLFPAIIFSLALLAMTYVLVSRYYSRGKRVKFLEADYYRNRKAVLILFTIVLLMGTPVFITVVVYLSLLTSALYFFMTGMIMILDGYVVMIILSGIFSISRNLKKAGLPISLIATAMVFVWFYPPVAYLAFSNPAFFAIMNISMLCSGLMYGFVYITAARAWKDVLNEYVSTVFGIFSLIIFYVMLRFQIRIWHFFSLQSQVEFALLSWVVMLPVMWITTQVSLNRLSGSKEVILNAPA